MKRRWQIITVLALIFVSIGITATTAGLRMRALDSHTDTRDINITVNDAALRKTPKWKPDAQNPPLSARKALKVADDLKNTIMKDSKEWAWVLGYMKLVPPNLRRDGTPDPDRWYWMVIYYKISTKTLKVDSPNELRLIVFMDGKAVKPNISRNELKELLKKHGRRF